MSNRPDILDPTPGQQEFIPRLLNGSQAKTAFALRMNAERMIAEGGLNATGFLTLTVGEYESDADLIEGQRARFVQVTDAEEASRRINNLNRRVLSMLFERAIIVTERHRSGAIHFHVLGVLKGRPDIRTGFDWPAFDRLRAAKLPFRARHVGANDELARRWKMLRDTLPRYGFGRAELTPIKKTGEAVASYVSKYIEKNVCNRTKADHRKKLVRYLGWEKRQLKPNEFSWAGEKARAWRAKARESAALVGVRTREEAAEAMGPRWAFRVSNTWKATGNEDLRPGISLDGGRGGKIFEELSRFVCPTWKRRRFPILDRKITLADLHRAEIWGSQFRHGAEFPAPALN